MPLGTTAGDGKLVPTSSDGRGLAVLPSFVDSIGIGEALVVDLSLFEVAGRLVRMGWPVEPIFTSPSSSTAPSDPVPQDVHVVALDDPPKKDAQPAEILSTEPAPVEEPQVEDPVSEPATVESDQAVAVEPVSTSDAEAEAETTESSDIEPAEVQVEEAAKVDSTPDAVDAGSIDPVESEIEEVPVEMPAEIPAEMPAEIPAEMPAEIPPEVPAEEDKAKDKKDQEEVTAEAEELNVQEAEIQA